MAELSTLARPYAVAAFKMATSPSKLAEWSQMLQLLAQVVGDEQFIRYMRSPNHSRAQVVSALLAVCGQHLSEQAQNLVRLLAEYGRIALLPQISEAFEALKAQVMGELQVEIIAATQPSDSAVKTLVRRLETRFNKKIMLQLTVNTDLIGGMKIRVGDTLIDASIQGQLQSLSYALVA